LEGIFINDQPNGECILHKPDGTIETHIFWMKYLLICWNNITLIFLFNYIYLILIIYLFYVFKLMNKNYFIV
jgi:hypothetical protein